MIENTKMHRNGFTLVEVLITMVIVGILITITVPIYTDYIHDNRLKSAAETFYAGLNNARSEAIKQNKVVNVVYKSGTNWCVGYTTASSCDCAVAGQCNLGQVESSRFVGTTLALSNGMATQTSFDGDRGIVSVTGTVTFSAASGDAISVILNKLGFARICSANLSGYQSC